MVKTERNFHKNSKRNLGERGKKGQQETMDNGRDDCQKERKKEMEVRQHTRRTKDVQNVNVASPTA